MPDTLHDSVIINHKTGRPFKTGLTKPTQAYKLIKAAWHEVLRAPPAQWAIVPKTIHIWGNDRYGDCVTAEEAYAKACYHAMTGGPEIFIPEAEVIRWARAHGVLNGASLDGVLDDMVDEGFRIGNQLYNNGKWRVVDYNNQDILHSALSEGPVKIAIASGALPSGAGNQSGWWDTGDPRNRRTDHCVALSGYGPAGWLIQQMQLVGYSVSLPSGLAAETWMYLLFTWGTIGLVDHAWIRGTTDEAMLRNPTTIGVPPLPAPTPPPGPGPGPGPSPLPPLTGARMHLDQALPAGDYLVFGTVPI